MMYSPNTRRGFTQSCFLLHLREKGPAGGRMRGNLAAFTLIELLVVVLIIGILAAVAVPQYQFAVDKSRVARYLTKIKDLVKAQQVYFLANGAYVCDMRKLDIDLTNLCNLAGTEYNELRACDAGQWGVNVRSNGRNADGDCSVYAISLYYCEKGSDCFHGTDRTEMHFDLWFNINNGSVISCSPFSTRGQKLCKWLKPN